MGSNGPWIRNQRPQKHKVYMVWSVGFDIFFFLCGCVINESPLLIALDYSESLYKGLMIFTGLVLTRAFHLFLCMCLAVQCRSRALVLPPVVFNLALHILQ